MALIIYNWTSLCI